MSSPNLDVLLDRAVTRLRLVEGTINQLATDAKERGHDKLAADLCVVGALIHGALKDITITRARLWMARTFRFKEDGYD